jgi:hypothetical protein
MLGANGSRLVVSIDLEGRANTAVLMVQAGRDPTELSFTATEHCKDLQREILWRSVAWKEDRAHAHGASVWTSVHGCTTTAQCQNGCGPCCGAARLEGAHVRSWASVGREVGAGAVDEQ